MKKTHEELEKECTEAAAKVEQYQHRGQRYENRIRPNVSGRMALTWRQSVPPPVLVQRIGNTTYEVSFLSLTY